MNNKLRLAIIDMNNGHANLGLAGIIKIVSAFEDQLGWQVFDARVKNELPDLSFDIYISSGGPGDPNETGLWKDQFFGLVDAVWAFNRQSEHGKYFFFICHSFQMVCDHFGLAEIHPRKSSAFGIYPVHKTAAGLRDELLSDLSNPYTVVDAREYQIIQPNLRVFKKWGAEILSLEKIRTHVELERAIMAVRFSEFFVGTQYHPEAEPAVMKAHFAKTDSKEKVVRNFGEKKYNKMMVNLDMTEKLNLTHQVILPKFIRLAVEKISAATPEMA